MTRRRVWQLARETGLSTRDVIEGLLDMGIEATSHAATVSEREAERFLDIVNRERGAATPGGMRVDELAEQLGMDTGAVIILLEELGVHAKSPTASVWDFDADRLLTWLEGRERWLPLEDPTTTPPGDGPPVTLRRPPAGEPGDTPRAARLGVDHHPGRAPPPTRTVEDASTSAGGVAGTEAGGTGTEAGERPGVGSRSDRNLVRRVLREIRPYWRGLTGLVTLDLLATPLALLKPIPLAIAIDTVLGDDPIPGFIAAIAPEALTRSDLRVLLLAALLQVAIVLFGQLQSLGAYVLNTYTGERLTRGFRAHLFSRAQQLSLLYHYRHGPTDALYRIEYDAPSVQHTVDSALPLVSSTVMFVATIYVTARIDGQLALVALAISPVLFLLSRGYAGRIRPRYRELRELESSELSVVQEVLSAIRVVKAFGREAHERDRFVDRSNQVVRARVSLSIAEGSFGLGINLTTAVGTALVLYIGVRHVLAGALTLGQLTIVLGYLAQLYAPLRSVSQRIGDVQNSIAGVERAFELLDQPSEVEERPGARRLEHAEGALAFEDVRFSYDGQIDVLRDVTFAIEPGTRLGIAGRTGAGKTTLVSLVTRFYDPTRGRILLDGVDIRDYRVADLRDQFALVLQEPVLFSTTVRENLRYARPDARQDDIVAAARAADAHDFICALPEGYDTVVGDRGMRLSGGERQRVSLARAFLKDAPVLILDEPTSSVDRETEATIMAAMQRLMVGRTALMIAHRLSTLEHCDAVIELRDGRARFAGADGLETADTAA